MMPMARAARQPAADPVLNRGLRELAAMSRAVGHSQEYAQGGGGNSSVKLADGRMLIKASGFRLQEVSSEGRGAVLVDYRAVREFFSRRPPRAPTSEDAATAFVNGQAVNLPGQDCRPSIETGFHSFLGVCVLHTHSVYANALNCAEHGEQTLAKLARNAGWRAIFVRFATPGLRLTEAVRAAAERYSSEHGSPPQVVFLQNHGLIVSGESAGECLRLHAAVNAKLRSFLKVRAGDYPQVRLKPTAGQRFVDGNRFLPRHLEETHAGGSYFLKHVICPDQVVYGLGGLTFTGDPAALVAVDAKKRCAYYSGTAKQAAAAAETLVAVAYVLELQRRAGLRPRLLKAVETKTILGMGSEKYRQRLLK